MLIAVLVIGSFLTINTIRSNNEVVENVKNIKDISGHIEYLTKLKSENLEDDLSISDLSVSTTPLSDDTLIAIKKLEDKLKSMDDISTISECSDLVDNGLTAEDCEIINASIGLFNIDGNSVELQQTKNNSKYISSVKNVLKRKNINSEKNETTNKVSFDVSVASSFGLKTYMKSKYKDDRVIKNIDMFLKYDSDGNVSSALKKFVKANSNLRTNEVYLKLDRKYANEANSTDVASYIVNIKGEKTVNIDELNETAKNKYIKEEQQRLKTVYNRSLDKSDDKLRKILFNSCNLPTHNKILCNRIKGEYIYLQKLCDDAKEELNKFESENDLDITKL
jgi:hypothetical protein